jgi:hypothetical protein
MTSKGLLVAVQLEYQNLSLQAGDRDGRIRRHPILATINDY